MIGRQDLVHPAPAPGMLEMEIRQALQGRGSLVIALSMAELMQAPNQPILSVPYNSRKPSSQKLKAAESSRVFPRTCQPVTSS